MFVKSRPSYARRPGNNDIKRAPTFIELDFVRTHALSNEINFHIDVTARAGL
jgi:hypothetical protein